MSWSKTLAQPNIHCGCGGYYKQRGKTAHERGSTHQHWVEEHTLEATGWAPLRSFTIGGDRSGAFFPTQTIENMLVTARFPIRKSVFYLGNGRCSATSYTREWVLDLLRDAAAELSGTEAEAPKLRAHLEELLAAWRENHLDSTITEWEASAEAKATVIQAITSIESKCSDIEKDAAALPEKTREYIRTLSRVNHRPR